ncbi:MAG: hypothetical protein WCD89_23165 [Anaerocolumna sp.]
MGGRRKSWILIICCVFLCTGLLGGCTLVKKESKEKLLLETIKENPVKEGSLTGTGDLIPLSTW